MLTAEEGPSTPLAGVRDTGATGPAPGSERQAAGGTTCTGGGGGRYRHGRVTSPPASARKHGSQRSRSQAWPPGPGSPGPDHRVSASCTSQGLKVAWPGHGTAQPTGGKSSQRGRKHVCKVATRSFHLQPGHGASPARTVAKHPATRVPTAQTLLGAHPRLGPKAKLSSGLALLKTSPGAGCSGLPHRHCRLVEEAGGPAQGTGSAAHPRHPPEAARTRTGPRVLPAAQRLPPMSRTAKRGGRAGEGAGSPQRGPRPGAARRGGSVDNDRAACTRQGGPACGRAVPLLPEGDGRLRSFRRGAGGGVAQQPRTAQAGPQAAPGSGRVARPRRPAGSSGSARLSQGHPHPQETQQGAMQTARGRGPQHAARSRGEAGRAPRGAALQAWALARHTRPTEQEVRLRVTRATGSPNALTCPMPPGVWGHGEALGSWRRPGFGPLSA